MKNFLSKYSLTLFWIFSFIIIIFMMSFTVNAETINPLPYYVNANYSNYFHLTSDQLDLITSYTSTSNENLFWLGEPYNYSSTYYGVYLFGLNTSDSNTFELKSGDLTYDVNYGMFDADNNYVEVSRTGGTYIKKIIRIHKTTGEWSFANGSTFPSVRDVTLLHLSTKTFNDYGYTVGVPFLFQDTQPIYFNGNLDQPLFLNGTPIPPEPEDDNITDEVEKPSFSDYIVDWTTGKPTFDSEHPFDSLFDIMSWSFGKLGDTLSGGFNFIVDSLNWSLQTLLNNFRSLFQLVIDVVNDIGDLIDDFIDTVSGFLSDIKDDIDYIIEPVNLTEVNTAWTNSSTYGIYNSFNTFFTTFDAVFNNTSEPQNLVIPIHIENISLFYNFGCRTPIYLDLSQYGDFRTPIRAFCWVFVSFGAVFLTENQLSMWLQGGSSSSGSTKGGG